MCVCLLDIVCIGMPCLRQRVTADELRLRNAERHAREASVLVVVSCGSHGHREGHFVCLAALWMRFLELTRTPLLMSPRSILDPLIYLSLLFRARQKTTQVAVQVFIHKLLDLLRHGVGDSSLQRY